MDAIPEEMRAYKPIRIDKRMKLIAHWHDDRQSYIADF